MEANSLPSAPPSGQPVCWSSVLQKKPPAKQSQEAISSRVFGSCTSSSGIAVAVVDANALIHGDKLAGCADKFVSVREVLEEVRDPVSRQRLSFLPFPVETMEPSPEFIKKAVKFARETGDLQTLSDVDLKLIALTYMLEAQIHGTEHLRDRPPPLQVVNVKNLPEAEMPGWGSNVPNLSEWESLEQATEGGVDHNSRILALKDLNNQAEPDTGSSPKLDEQDNESPSFSNPKRFFPPKKEIVLEGKKMVAAGIDASQGEDKNSDDWRPAVSRSTHRRYLRRKARRELSKESGENGNLSCNGDVDAAVSEGNSVISDDDAECPQFSHQHVQNEISVKEEQLDEKVEGDALHFDSSRPSQEEKEHDIFGTDRGSEHPAIEEDDEIDEFSEELDNLELSSEPDGSIGTTCIEDQSSEQSWMLKSLSESSVACVTSDYAMQNVLLQIGLRLLAPGGMQIHQLHRWVLKCHACNKITQEIGRIFCPKCGNGGTLRKVSVTVGENGILMAARRQRIILRGTKFSLPLPQGGREAITKNLILREDQLPHKLLYPKSKKKSNKQDQDFLGTDDIFSHSGEKRVPLKPPVKKALSMFGGKRNPNDNHFSRRKH